MPYLMRMIVAPVPVIEGEAGEGVKRRAGGRLSRRHALRTRLNGGIAVLA
jgi:hypothetical protein